MRPALLRLLRRPSAVSILDCLVSTPSGIEQLESRYKCLRCQSRSVQQNTGLCQTQLNLVDDETPARRRRARAKSFRIHEIEPPWSNASNVSLDDFTKLLKLQPEKLEFESDVGHTDDLGTRLVDQPSYRLNFALWEVLLRYRQRHYGDEGTLEIWKGLTIRVDSVLLPVIGERADFFWRSFIGAGLKKDSFLKDLADYALELWKATGNRWGGFYDSVVGGFLERGMLQQAVEWHKTLQNPHLAHPNDILRVLELAMASCPLSDTTSLIVPHRNVGRRMSPGVRAFQDICRATDGHRIYGPVISNLLKHGYSMDALLMHGFLTERQDHPRDFEEIQPLLDYAEKYESPAVFKGLQEYARHRFESQPVSNGPEKASPQESHPKGKGGRWLKHKPTKDEFAARLFATHALTFDMIVGGLQMFGVRAIGPQPLREMAARAHGCQDLLEKLNKLQKAGISTGDSVFARLVRKLATEDRWFLLSELVSTDQHPDVFENAALQESLLTQYYVARDWQQYNMALAILDLVSGEGPEMFNVHFRKHIAAREWSAAAKIVDDMTLRGKTLANQSMEFLIAQVLTPRRRGVGPAAGCGGHAEDEVGFLFRIFRRVVPAGVFVPPELWIELLKRLGMTRRWDRFRELSLWIAQYYAPSTERSNPSGMGSFPPSGRSSATGMGPPPSRPGDRMLERIFNPQMQAAIVAWGFMMRLSSKPETKACRIPSLIEQENGNPIVVPWVRGLALLRELEREGIRLREQEIRRACRQRLAVLFGRPRHSSRRWNRLLRRENPYDVHQVLADVARAWGCSLFGDQENDVERLVNPPSSKMSQRRTHRTLFREVHFEKGAFVQSK